MGFAFYGGRRSLGIVYVFDKQQNAAYFIYMFCKLHNGGLRPNLAHILYLITKFDILLGSLLFIYYNRDNAEYDCFPASGRRDSLCIVYFFD